MTARQVEKAFIQNRQGAHYVSNLFLYGWESDLLEIRKTGQVVEYEIKTTKSDFRADFQKRKHDIFKTVYNTVDIPNYFYFLTEEGVVNLEDIPEYAGLVVILRHGLKSYPRVIKKAPILHNNTLNEEHWKKLSFKLLNRLP